MFKLTILALISTIELTGVKAYKVSVYPQTAIVTNIDYESDIVTVTDFNGNDWTFNDCSDWMEGDIASMIMSDNGTDEIYDDIILYAKYSGYIK